MQDAEHLSDDAIMTGDLISLGLTSSQVNTLDHFLLYIHCCIHGIYIHCPQVVEMHTRITEQLHVMLPAATLLQCATIREYYNKIVEAQNRSQSSGRGRGASFASHARMMSMTDTNGSAIRAGSGIRSRAKSVKRERKSSGGDGKGSISPKVSRNRNRSDAGSGLLKRIPAMRK